MKPKVEEGPSAKRVVAIPREEIDDEYRTKACDNSLPRGIVILLLMFSLTLDKSTGKLWSHPFVFFNVFLASAPCQPHADDSGPASVAATKKQPGIGRVLI